MTLPGPSISHRGRIVRPKAKVIRLKIADCSETIADRLLFLAP
jgi:hypothetical protein